MCPQRHLSRPQCAFNDEMILLPAQVVDQSLRHLPRELLCMEDSIITVLCLQLSETRMIPAVIIA